MTIAAMRHAEGAREKSAPRRTLTRVAAPVVAVAALSMAALACESSDTAPSDPPTTPRPSSPVGSESTATGTNSGSPAPSESSRARPHRVIVTFDVDWRPEPELSPDQVRAQRDRVVRAQRAVLSALGEHGELHREYHATAQASLNVSDDGLELLEHQPEVATYSRDTPDPAN